MRLVKHLGGSNGASLYETDQGFKVVKKCKSESHAQNELEASMVYRVLGINTPEIRKDGNTLTIEYIPDSQLLRDTVVDYRLIQLGFVADCLLANWDSIGLEYDNILVQNGMHGIVHRIDTGGALRYRAMGAKKTLNGQVTELQTMRDSSINPQAASIFGSISDKDIRHQIRAILEKREAILAVVGQDIRYTISERIDYLEAYASQHNRMV